MIYLGTVVFSTICCALYLFLARRWALMDTPNDRSSHSNPTPHGGGVAIILAFMVGLIMAGWQAPPWNGVWVLMAILALWLMILGVLDDLHGLSVKLRLSIYGLVCLAAAASILSSAPYGPPAGHLILAIPVAFAMLWFINLFNFMDGIDGLAALQSIFVSSAAALLSVMAGQGGQFAVFCLLLAAAQAGFLLFNWPPAKLFMGDAGSVSTGFLLAALALLGTVQGQLSALSWLILVAVFVTDASWTLLWRVATRQAFTQAHRQHAYQRLSRRFNSHLKVDAVVMAINLFWLLPLAGAVVFWPEHGLILVILAYLPLMMGMAKVSRLT